MQTMIEKLRLIADAIEHGKDVEYKEPGETLWSKENIPGAFGFTEQFDYRIKPATPRTARAAFYTRHEDGSAKDYSPFDAVELTPEVKQALKDAGVSI